MASKPSKKSANIAKKGPAKRATAAAGKRPSHVVNARSASRLIDQRIRELGGWRGETLARIRALILQAEPDIVEECKWIKPTNPLGVPVWSHAGIVCTGEAYAKVVKLTFARGASIPRPVAPLQFQLGRQHAKGDRHPRRGEGQRRRVQGAGEGRGGPE